MQISSKRISLRFIIFSLISLIFTSFILALFCIYHETMPKILLESEGKNITDRIDEIMQWSSDMSGSIIDDFL